MGNFDPDAFLASGSTAVATPTPSGFNPDAFLAQGVSHPASSFNPDTFLAATAPPPPPSTTPAADQAAAEPTSITGKLGEVWRGIDIKSLPADVGKALIGLIGATESPKAFKQAWDVLHGVPVTQAIPESQTFVGIENKPIEERIKTGFDVATNLGFLKGGEKAVKKAAGSVPEVAPPAPVAGNEQFARVAPVNERAGAAVPADNPAPAQSTILEPTTQPEVKPVVPITEQNAAQAATDIGGLKYGGVQSWPADSGIPSTLEFTITEPGKETTLSVPPGITPEELAARRDAKIARFEAEQPKPLHVFKDIENGTEARIYSGTKGEFNVVLHDTDANQTVPVAQIFKSEDSAIAYAKNLSGGDQIPSTGEGSGHSGMEARREPLKRSDALIQRGNEPGNLPAAQEPPPLNKDNLYYQKNLEARAYKMAQGFAWNGEKWVHPDYPNATPFSSDVPPPRPTDVQQVYQKLKQGDQNASSEPSAAGVSSGEVRGSVDEGTPLQQQGETAPVQPQGTERGSEPQQTQEAPVSGINNERLYQIYGKDAIASGKGNSPKRLQEMGRADTRDPYSVLSNAQRNGIATGADVAKLRDEHNRLLEVARNSYGTPQYPELAQRAVDMANAIKGVAHGPASEVFRALQEADIPRYTSPADFDNIVRERMQRESTPEEQTAFKKVTDEVNNGDREAVQAATDARTLLRKSRLRAAKEPMQFDDAADYIRKQIADLTKDCIT